MTINTKLMQTHSITELEAIGARTVKSPTICMKCGTSILHYHSNGRMVRAEVNRFEAETELGDYIPSDQDLEKTN